MIRSSPFGNAPNQSSAKKPEEPQVKQNLPPPKKKDLTKVSPPPKANQGRQFTFESDIPGSSFQSEMGLGGAGGGYYDNLGNRKNSGGINNNLSPNTKPGAYPSFDYCGYDDNNAKSEYDLIKSDYENNIMPFNCSKDFLSTTFNVFPSNSNLITKCNLPLGLSISPMSNESNVNIPVIDYNPKKIPRCPNTQCRAYLNPFVKFIEGGERWICNFCGQKNITEEYYYCDTDKNGVRLDQYTKPELCNGSYEFVTDKSYWKKAKTPTEAMYIFLLETSASAVNSSFLTAAIESIKDVVSNESFYNGASTKVCFITYDSGVYFYSFNKRQTQPKVLTVFDEPVFVPTVNENLVFTVGESKDKIMQILELIENNNSASSNNNMQINRIKDSEKLFSALNGAFLIGGKMGGAKIIVFSSSNILGSINKMNGTDLSNLSKEQQAYACHDKKQLGTMGINLTNDNMSCDIFASAESHIKILTLNQLCEYTNGNLFFYKNFNLDLHYKNIYNQINRVLTRPICWEGVCRTRFSNKYKIGSYLTPVLITNDDLFVFPTGDSDQHYQIGLTIKKEIIPENKEKENNNYDFNYNNENENNKYFYIQSALLYSYGDGTRRVRVHNLCLPLSNNLKDILDSVNQENLSIYYIKQVIDKIYKTKNITNSVAAMEMSFRSLINCAMNLQQKMKKELSEKFSLMPLYMLGMMKHRIFCKDEVERKYDIDLSNFLRLKLQKMSAQEIISFICPFIYAMHELDSNSELGKINEETQCVNMPSVIEDSMQFLEENGLYLIDNGYLIVVYVRKNVSKSILKFLFEVEDLQFLTMIVNEENVFKQSNDFKERFMNIVDYIRGGKSLYQNMIFVFEGTKSENIIKDSLIEDNFCSWYRYDYSTYYKKCIQDNMLSGYGY